jgi:hypothetical protein
MQRGCLTRDGGSKKPKTKHKVKKYQEAVRVQNHLIQAPELKVQETFHTPTGPSSEDEDDKVFEVPAIDHDVERISAIESEIMERYEKMKFRLGE